MDRPIEIIEVEDGKYRFEYNPAVGILICKRNGEIWRDFIGDKAVYALFSKIQELSQKVEELEVRLELHDYCYDSDF